MSYAIFRQAAQPQLAMRVLENAVAAKALAHVARATGRVPARRSAVELAAPDLPFLSQSAEILGRAVTRPTIPLYPRVSTQLQAMLEAVLTGRLGPAEASKHAADLIEAITGLPIAQVSVTDPIPAVA
jgi:multiple sugar transport system substrate-binding protein